MFPCFLALSLVGLPLASALAYNVSIMSQGSSNKTSTFRAASYAALANEAHLLPPNVTINIVRHRASGTPTSGDFLLQAAMAVLDDKFEISQFFFVEVLPLQSDCRDGNLRGRAKLASTQIAWRQTTSSFWCFLSRSDPKYESARGPFERRPSIVVKRC